MRISVVIPAYNVGRTIARTLQACLQQDIGAHEIEVVVVDDGSTDDTAEQVQRFPVRYVRQENAGAAAARNTGSTHATGDIIFFIDADCAPVAGSLHSLIEALSDDSEATVAGGVYAAAREMPLLEAAINEEIRYRHMRAPERVQHLGSFCMAMRREDLRTIGPFNPRHERFEDLELSYRAVDRGYTLRALQDVQFIHLHPRTLSSWLKDQHRKAYGRVENVLSHSKVLKRDGYVDYRDWASLLLALGSALLVPFVWLRGVGWMIVAGLSLNLILQLPLVAFAIRDTGDRRLAVLMPLQLLRGFAWAAGALAGLWASAVNRRGARSGPGALARGKHTARQDTAPCLDCPDAQSCPDRFRGSGADCGAA